jgi:hypothetical protein
MHYLATNEKVEVLANSDFLRFLKNPIGFLFVKPVKARFKGKLGEFKVNLGVDFLLDNKVYRLVKDVTLPAGDGTTQIDHLVVSPFGIFVIETKNMKGWIFGRQHQAQWTQTIYGDRRKFQNPLRQNYKHVKAVQELLGLASHQVHNVVAFVGGCEFKTPMPAEVVHGVSSLADFIRSKPVRVFAEDEVPLLVDSLLYKRLHPSLRSSFSHMHSVERQTTDGTVVPKACPRCGGVMVERTNRRTGQRFLGCKRYPQCEGECPGRC